MPWIDGRIIEPDIRLTNGRPFPAASAFFTTSLTKGTTMTEPTAPSPQLFFDAAFTVQRTRSIKAAIDLEIFTAIKGRPHDAP